MNYEKLTALDDCPLFEDIDAPGRTSILNCLQPRIRRYPNKDLYVGLEGEKLSGVGVILQGEIAVVKEDHAGNRLMIARFGAGELIGEVAAFSSEQLWPATTITSGPCEIMFISINKIIDSCPNQCSEHRQLITNVLKIIANRALVMNRKMNYLMTRSLRVKISNYLLEQYKKHGKPIFELPLTRQELADYLHVSRPSLSREIGRMRDEGIISFHLNRFKIKSMGALKKAADGLVASKN
ncbi:MAG: Crp/Fnr family transcriptional regulator [Firmicutes bacterium]|nr:Crp/Fnr family transcriptional regulator [Bacillota bacterium]